MSSHEFSSHLISATRVSRIQTFDLASGWIEHGSSNEAFIHNISIVIGLALAIGICIVLAIGIDIVFVCCGWVGACVHIILQKLSCLLLGTVH
jgi:hypothetical protein